MNSKPPFFILGAQRSGTTMLRLMLNSHPRLAVPHESKFILAFYPKLREYPNLHDGKTVGRLLDDIAAHSAVRAGKLMVDRDRVLANSIETFADLVDAIMSAKAASMGKERWGDKTPYYTPDIDVLWEIFPKAQIIHLVRDGRDVAVSQRSIEWLGNSMPRLAADWRWKATICHKVGSVRGSDHFLEVKYEDLVRDTETTLRRICAFLDEEYVSQMLRYHETAQSEVPTESLRWHGSSVSRPDPSKVGIWKKELSESDRIIFEEIAGDTLDLFAYEREHLASTWKSRFKNLYYALAVRY